jgi:hypothetical protein
LLIFFRGWQGPIPAGFSTFSAFDAKIKFVALQGRDGNPVALGGQLDPVFAEAGPSGVLGIVDLVYLAQLRH